MRILILTHEFPPYPGGVATYAYEMASAAAGLGHSVSVLAPDFHRRGSPDDRAENVPFGLRTFRGDKYRSSQFPRVLASTYAETRRRPWDVIHAMEWPFALAARYLRLARKAEVIATVYGTEMLYLPTSRPIKWLRIEHPYAEVSRMCAISRYTAELMTETWPSLQAKELTVTPLGVSDWWLEPPDESDTRDIEEMLQRAGGEKVVTTVARVVERKGHMGVIRALGQMPPQDRDRVVYAVAGSEGPPEYVSGLEDLAAQVGVRLVLCGALTKGQVRGLLSITDVFAMPGTASENTVEGFGLAYLEAGAQSVPSIATAIGGASEAVVHEATGLVVAPGDQPALDTALERLLGNAAYRECLGRGAQRHAKENSWMRVAEATYGTASGAPKSRPF